MFNIHYKAGVQEDVSVDIVLPS